MKKNEANSNEEIKTDLKHDTMEYLTDEQEINEEDDITAEELDTIEDDVTDEAYALDAVETDKQADEDNLPEEDWEDDISD